MKTATLIIALLAILLMSSTSSAEPVWKWEENPSFFSANISSELAGLEGSFVTGGLNDLNGDGKPEYALVYATRNNDYRLYLANVTGEYPDWHWSLVPDFFPGLDIPLDSNLQCVSFFDLDRDGAVEIILGSDIILKNEGTFDQPNWVRADNLFPPIDRQGGFARFCDWDGDDNPDLMVSNFPEVPDSAFVAEASGFVWYSRNGEGGWDSLGFIQTPVVHLIQIADLDNDSDMDFIMARWMYLDSMSVGRDDGEQYYDNGFFLMLNRGSPEQPEWAEPILNEDLYRPYPYDINGDGWLDLVGNWRYATCTGSRDSLSYNRLVYWNGLGGGPLAAANIVGDEQVELLCGVHHSNSFMDQRWKLVQMTLTPAGWADSYFFGGDYSAWGSGFIDFWGITAASFLPGEGLQLAVARSEGMMENSPMLGLYHNVANGEAWDWQEVEGFFDPLIDTISYRFQPAFGDFDSDGDLDLAMVNGADSWGWVHFYEYSNEGGNNVHWTLRPDWGNAQLDTVAIITISAGDFDGDGRCDLILSDYLDGVSHLKLYCNTSADGDPTWSLELNAFTEGGPQVGVGNLIVADLNLDRKPDLIADRSVFLNQSTNSVRPNRPLPTTFSASIAPNPTNGAATVYYETPVNGAGRVTIYDSNGKSVWGSNLGWQTAGSHTVEVATTGLPSGVYQVELRIGTEQRRLALTVLK